MTDPHSQPLPAAEPDEQVLAQFVGDWEERGAEVLDEYVRRYPPLAGELRALASMQELLDAPPPDGQQAMPRRLGEFFVLRRIGAGGMGEIYEAVQQRLNRRVAVKTIRHGRIAPRDRERFLREQRVLAKLHHTHIVPIHTAGEEGPLQFFVMPYIDGAPLHRVVRMLGELDAGTSGGNTPSLAKLAGMAASDADTSADRPPAAEARAPFATTRDQRSPDLDRIAPHEDRGRSEAAAQCGLVADLASVPTCTPASGNLTNSATTPARRASPRTLSLEYFRSVAELMADAAEALGHAHDVHVLHRDMKPSNIMVDVHGQCWLIDFGLAGYLNAGRDAAAPADGKWPAESAASGFVGTPNYMAPEQLRGRSDVRTDVWGLGVTLYELLTLARAFSASTSQTVYDAIERADPVPIRELVANVPHDLVAICRRAMAHSREHRYQTSRQFAADLRRWLAHEPTVARPARPVRRALLWSRRNKGWAAAGGTLVVALVCGVLALLVSAAAKEREDKRQGLLSKQVALRLAKPRPAGWSQVALSLVVEAAELRHADDLRDNAAAALVGLDTRRVDVKALEEIGASSVAWSSDGLRLLLGGTSDSDGKPRLPAKIVDVETGAVRESPLSGDGAVAWRADGTALHAALIDAQTVQLCDVETGKVLGKFRLTVEGTPPAFDRRLPPIVALAPDGASLALATTIRNGTGVVAVWNVVTSEPLGEFKCHATALGFSPRGKFLATGDDNGVIKLWLPNADEPVAKFSAGRSTIRALAFGRDPWVKDTAEAFEGETPLLLAAGNDGGKLVVWDIATKQPRTFGHRTLWEIGRVAFSADGALLVSGGRQMVRVWDAATGDPLLEIRADDTILGLELTADGKRIAIAAINPESSGETPATVFIHELENGRGMASLHGLNGQVIQVRYSSDGRYIAALSVDWQVGIWQASNGRLMHVLEAPKGIYADNAGFAFSPDGRRFAFATSGGARMWDVESGTRLRDWPLNRGLQEQLAFNGDKLLLFRAEREIPDAPAANDPSKNRFVCRLYDLPRNGDPRLIEPEKPNSWEKVMKTAGRVDGSLFVVDAWAGPGLTNRTVAAFDGLTGQRRWSIASKHRHPAGSSISFDPTGEFVGAAIDDLAKMSPVLDARTGVEVCEFVTFEALGPGANWAVGKPGKQGYQLVRRGEDKPIVDFGLDSPTSAQIASFNSAGTHVAWGNADGTVTVCDIAEVRRRLDKLGLAWPE